ncbi:MAG: glycosyltransferase family 4 protein [Bacteroidales bacterium]|nr:glycosyltransferase family 4 protein [Bacteroidales bacterium]
MKTIVILTEHYFEYALGGAEYQILLLTQELLKSGHELHYIYIDYGCRNDTAKEINLHPLKVKTLSRKLGANFFLYGSDIVNYLNNIKPEFIYHRNLSAFAGIAAKYCAVSECKLVWHIANEPDVQPFRLSRVRTAMFDFIDKMYAEHGIRHADYIIGQARYQEELLLNNYGRKCNLIIGNWHPVPTEKSVKELPNKVVWIANFKPQKHPEIFIELARRFLDYNDIEFIMIGRPASGEFQQQLEDKIGKIDNLTYLGEKTIDEVNLVLGESHVFVNTSEYEGFANTFVQAWMREVPVVSLTVDPDDLLKTEKIGFHSGNFENLFCDTKRLIENQVLLSDMGKKARKYAETYHSLKKNVGKIIDCIESGMEK